MSTSTSGWPEAWVALGLPGFGFFGVSEMLVMLNPCALPAVASSIATVTSPSSSPRLGRVWIPAIPSVPPNPCASTSVCALMKSRASTLMPRGVATGVPEASTEQTGALEMAPRRPLP